MDLVTASKMIDTAMNVLKEQRSSNHFDNLLTKARAIAKKEDISTDCKIIRMRKPKQMAGEKARDDQVTDPKVRFRSSVCYVIYDTLIAELASHFVDFQKTVTNFKCLMPPHLGNMEDFKHLTAIIYCEDVEVELAISEYKQFCDFYKATPEFEDNPPDILQSMLIMIKEWDINNACPNLSILYRIMGTIAISSATFTDPSAN